MISGRSIASCLTLSLLAALSLLGCDEGSDSDEPKSGVGGTPSSSGGGKATAGVSGTSGGSTATGSGGGGNTTSGTPPGFGTATYVGKGSTSERYGTVPVRRNGVEYVFMPNGWGPNFTSHTVSWEGTSFSVDAMMGSQGSNYEPASYPTVFCGNYSMQLSGPCGLPKAISEIQTLYTGWRWAANGNTGQYNASYDIWLSNNTTAAGFSSFLMVWLRDPPGQRPAGSVKAQNVVVPGAPGTWELWVGSVSGKPYVAYSRVENQDTYEIEFDVMNFWRDATSRAVNLPGTHILSVAVGFEIWNGPVTNLKSEDFYVEVK